MARISEETINDIRRHADIVDVISHYIPIQRKGRAVKAVCPFHDDHDPSLSIAEDKQSYKCFVCSAGGNVFGFVQNYEKIGFVESVYKVAELCNYPLELPKESFLPKVDSRKASLHKVMNEAIAFMKFQLMSVSAKSYYEYLIQRGITKEVIEKFEIGFNGPNDQLRTFLKAKGHEDSNMLACNLIQLSQSGLHDVFYNRITFPIHDSLGNPIGFTARTLEKDAPKYINTNETELYVKGHVLYNYHRAKQPSRMAGRVIVTEGVMDVIAFSKAGIDNVTATLGTACTKEQIRLLMQCSKTICFCYDGDKAGQNATAKAAKLASSMGANVEIIDNQTRLDPDEIIEKYGKEALIKMTKKTMTLMEFMFEWLKKQYNLDNYSEKKQFALRVKEEIEQCQDDFDRQNFTHQLSLVTGFNLAQLAVDVTKPVKQEPVKNNRPQRRLSAPLDGKTKAERQILSQMLTSKHACEIFKSQLGFLLNDTSQKCAMIIVDAYRRSDVCEIAVLLDRAKEDEVKQLLVDVTSD
ncbi:MAG: DNA primase, partial [Erysipelotrichaceae bacterium]|nr:DNA primase [Erysipelotrichaceae bacterium]